MKHCTLLSLLHQYMKNTTASQRCMLLYACLNIVHCFFLVFLFLLDSAASDSSGSLSLPFLASIVLRAFFPYALACGAAYVVLRRSLSSGRFLFFGFLSMISMASGNPILGCLAAISAILGFAFYRLAI